MELRTEVSDIKDLINRSPHFAESEGISSIGSDVFSTKEM